jgi:hypothetical protein
MSERGLWLPSAFEHPEHVALSTGQADLARHEREIHEHLSFNYAVLDSAESRLFGSVYIDPAERVGADADVCWWVIDDERGGRVAILETTVHRSRSHVGSMARAARDDTVCGLARRLLRSRRKSGCYVWRS